MMRMMMMMMFLLLVVAVMIAVPTRETIRMITVIPAFASTDITTSS